jgi:hypothetical protein
MRKILEHITAFFTGAFVFAFFAGSGYVLATHPIAALILAEIMVVLVIYGLGRLTLLVIKERRR